MSKDTLPASKQRSQLASLLRLIGLFYLILRGVATVLLCFPFADEQRRRRYKQDWMLAILSWLQIKTLWPTSVPAAGCLLVGNHISWLDIMVINAWQQVDFVAKKDVRSWPLIGWLAATNGTIFLQRGQRSAAYSITVNMQQALNSGKTLVIFPEGTTTLGEGVGHFHSALFEPASQGKHPVVPMAISYFVRQQDGAELSASTAPAYIGDTSLIESMWNVSRQTGLVAHLQLDQPLPDQQSSRRQLADAAQARVAALLKEAPTSVERC